MRSFGLERRPVECDWDIGAPTTSPFATPLVVGIVREPQSMSEPLRPLDRGIWSSFLEALISTHSPPFRGGGPDLGGWGLGHGCGCKEAKLENEVSAIFPETPSGQSVTAF